MYRGDPVHSAVKEKLFHAAFFPAMSYLPAALLIARMEKTVTGNTKENAGMIKLFCACIKITKKKRLVAVYLNIPCLT